MAGFDLVLGKLYNEGWFNCKEQSYNATCSKCKSFATTHHLHKFVFAFGNIIEKFTKVITCPQCLHEEELPSLVKFKKEKATKKNLTTIFSKLPKHIQEALLLGGSK